MPRPKSFDPDQALAKAMEVFWAKGYEGASVAELTGAMGINRFSLYDTFGDKHELYMQALARYERDSIDPLIDRIDAIRTLSDVRGLYASLVEHARSDSEKPCCMILRAAVAGTHDGPDACAKVRAIQDRIVHALTRAVERLTSTGHASASLDPNRAAWSLFTLQSGLIVSAASAPDPDTALASVDHWITAAQP